MSDNIDKIDIPEQLLHEYVIGIDLGTTNTCVSIWRDGCAEIIPDEFGNKTIPSFVAYTNKNRYIGYDAKRQKDINVKNVFYEVKRLIGRKIDDKFVINEKEFLSYDIVGDENNNILLKPDIREDKLFTPEEISAAILMKAKQMASNYLKRKITKCVITIPAHFNDGQRQATKDAAKIAGLECIRIINEPTAAALAYGLLERTKTFQCQLKNIMVYDFGGGTLDVSLLSIEKGIFDVIGTSGNTKLGGADFDKCLIDFCIKKFQYQNKDFSTENVSSLSRQKLRTSCEQAKQLLSTVTETHIAVKDFYNDKDLYYKVTRKQFEELCQTLFMKCLKPVNDILKQCDMDENSVDEIILVGGMTKVPKIRELLKIKFKKEPNCSINPDEAVAAGAGLQGYLLSHLDDPFSDTVTLLNSTALSLGVETAGGIMDVIVKRGEMIPTEEKKMYTTDTDYVDSIKIKVYEGERTLTKDNFLVGEFELMGLIPQPRGIAEIEVTFSIDANCIITVSALNKKTNDKACMAVTSNKGRLNQNEISSLIEEAREFEIRDEFEKRKKWLHYEIDDMCSNILINMKNKLIKLSDKDKEIIIDDIKKILAWLKEKSYDEREDDEYKKVLDSIKSKYTILIVKGNPNEENVQSVETQSQNMTSIYGNDDEEKGEEENKVFERLEDDEMGFKGMSDAEKEELKELRKSVNALCHDVFSIISSENLNISECHKNELKDYIDDTLLWLHVHNKIEKQEYIDKINEVNKNWDNITNYYKEQNVEIFKDNVASANKFGELENLCFSLRIMIEDGALPVKDEHLNKLKNLIEETIMWLYEQEELSQQVHDECENKINLINEASQSIQNIMQGLNLDENSDIFGKSRQNVIIPEFEIDEETNTNTGGTSIFDIMQRNNANVLERMIINDD